MPTLLPERRRTTAKAVPAKPNLGTKILNTFMVLSALVLTVVVLITEERYANHTNYDQTVAAEQIADQQKSP